MQRGIEVEYQMVEIGFPPDRVYQAALEFEMDGERYYSFYECDNKKMTQVDLTLFGPLSSLIVIQKKTAFEIVVALYKHGKLEPNTGRRNLGDRPSGNILGAVPMPNPYLNPNCDQRERDKWFVKSKLGMNHLSNRFQILFRCHRPSS